MCSNPRSPSSCDLGQVTLSGYLGPQKCVGRKVGSLRGWLLHTFSKYSPSKQEGERGTMTKLSAGPEQDKPCFMITNWNPVETAWLGDHVSWNNRGMSSVLIEADAQREAM